MNSRAWTRTYFCEWSPKQQTTPPPWKQTAINEKQQSKASCRVLSQQGHLSVYDVKIRLICYILYRNLKRFQLRIPLRWPRYHRGVRVETKQQEPWSESRHLVELRTYLFDQRALFFSEIYAAWPLKATLALRKIQQLV